MLYIVAISDSTPMVGDVPWSTAGVDCPEYKYTQMACLDFLKAFDKLQPYIVIDKKRNYGINTLQ